MPVFPFSSLPDNARVWVFASAQPILGDDAERLVAAAESFVRGWAAHGEPVVGAVDWRDDHFLLIAADEDATGVSGCSIDSLFNTLKQIERELGLSLLDSSLVWFRDDSGAVQVLPRGEFRELVDRGEVTSRTPVFDNTAGTLKQVREGEWERPFAESWHGKAFARRGRGAGC